MSSCLLGFVVLWFTCVVTIVTYGQQTVTITTDLGEIKGTEDSNSWSPLTIYSFKGIPYAVPPIGNLRFRQTILDTTKYNGVYDAIEYSSVCVQQPSSKVPQNISEDCLYLNIWTTKSNVDNSKNKLVPVMLWIHGGSLTGGSGVQDGTSIVGEYGDIVYVSINYRLGALGWLNNEAIYNEDPSWKSYGGMNGLYDQITAIKWVKQNIKSYGGDSNEITLFGESAGATSICTILVSPLAKGLIKRAISESGDCIGGWGPRTLSQGIEYGNQQLQKNNYPINNLTYLRLIPADTFINNVAVDFSVDGLVLTTLPYNLYSNGNTTLAANDSVMFGFNSLDGVDFLVGFGPKTEQEYKKSIAKYISNVTQQNMIYNIYYPPTSFPAYGKNTEYQMAWYTINCDLCVACPSLKIGDYVNINKMSERMYIYDFLGSGNGDGNYYAPHGSEIAFVFNYSDKAWDMPWNQNLSDSMLSAWVNFGKNGIPNITNKFENININWNQYDIQTQNVISFAPNIQNQKAFAKNYHQNACDFWYNQVGVDTMNQFCLLKGSE